MNAYIITPPKKKLSRKQERSIQLFVFFIAIVLWMNAFNPIQAQSVSASLDRDKILLGEQVVLQLKIEDFNTRTAFLNAWFNLPDSIDHIEVIKRDVIDTLVINGLTTYFQKITLTSFDSGQWQIPPLSVYFHPFAEGKTVTLKTNALSLQVLPVDVSNLKTYHEMKDIEEVVVKNNPWLIVSLIIITLLSLFFLWKFLIKNKKVVIPPPKAVIKGSPLEWAMEQIRILEEEDLPSKNQTKLFYTRLDEIYRSYFEEQLRISSLRFTSDEMMVKLKIYLQQEDLRTRFYQLIRLADAVKFAKYFPDKTQNEDAVKIVKIIIQHTDQLSQQMKYNNAY